MLSILIPVFNQVITDLIKELKDQGEKLTILFEILIFDDASDAYFHEQNRIVGDWENVTLITSEKNLGRAGARNKLANQANYPFLLFIDSDAAIPDTHYIQNYIPYLKEGVVICGGTEYENSPPKQEELILRWKYGKNREALSAKRRNKNPRAGFSGFNFLIDKNLFLSVQFHGELLDYGHEDTLFGYELMKKEAKVLHTDNPLIHLGLESTEIFVEKTRAGLKNLYQISTKHGEEQDFIKMIRLLRFFFRMKKIGILPLPNQLNKKILHILEKKLMHSNPNLLWFDLFKLLYFSSIYFNS